MAASVPANSTYPNNYFRSSCAASCRRHCPNRPGWWLIITSLHAHCDIFDYAPVTLGPFRTPYHLPYPVLPLLNLHWHSHLQSRRFPILGQQPIQSIFYPDCRSRDRPKPGRSLRTRRLYPINHRFHSQRCRTEH